MSIAVAVKKNNEIVIGTDSLVTFGSTIYPDDNYSDNKIRKIGDSFILSTGWIVYDNIFESQIDLKNPPKLTNKKEIFTFFVGFWKILHDKYHFVNDQCDDDSSPFGDIDTNFLIVSKNKIFEVCSDLSVSEYRNIML